MREVKLAYSDLYNAGDLMNVDIVELLGNCKTVRSKTYSAEMMAIGGALVGLQYSEKLSNRIVQHFIRHIYGDKPIYIWGSGFLHDYNDRRFYRTNLKVCALRGKKTQERLKELTGKWYDVPLADAGLLIDSLYSEHPEKKYKIGLIPHMWHQKDTAVVEMQKLDGVHLIDIRQTPRKVAEEIVQCETIVSTSLHGLIFADALHIPNMHMLGEKQLRGDNFKFEDYYSSYGLEDKAVKLSKHLPTHDEIIGSYCVDSALVEQKKKDLINTFPLFWQER